MSTKQTNPSAQSQQNSRGKQQQSSTNKQVDSSTNLLTSTPTNRSPTTSRTPPKSIKSDQISSIAKLESGECNEMNDEIQSKTECDNDLTQESNDNQLNNPQVSEDTNQDTNKNANQPNDEPPAKSNDEQEEKKDLSGPAFRLRARRSTPRKLDSFYSSPYTASRNKFSLYSPNNSDQLHARVAKLKSGIKSGIGDVKRNLFNSEPQTNQSSSQTPHRRTQSPSRSLVEEVDLNVFAENILVEKLSEGKNNLNYLCLRIIEVLDEEECSESARCSTDASSTNCPNSNDCSMNNCSSSIDNRPKQRLLKIYCQQAETKSVLNVQKPIVLLYLFNEYVSFKNKFIPGKLIEIVKFEVKKLPTPISYKHNSIDVNVCPFYVELKADRRDDWISLISIKKKYEPTNLSLLNVINTQNKYQSHDNIEDQPPTKNPKVIFSSYVVKTEPDEQQNNHNLQNTKSPTIKRFMKTFTKSYAQDNRLKLKKEKS